MVAGCLAKTPMLDNPTSISRRFAGQSQKQWILTGKMLFLELSFHPDAADVYSASKYHRSNCPVRGCCGNQ
jgi:hypothetical protein